MRKLPGSITFLFAALIAVNAQAKEFFVDPVAGSMTNDGSASAPWKTIQEVVDAGLIESQGWESLPYEEGKKLVPKNPGAPVKAGDTLRLRNGYHGSLAITGYYNTGLVTIAAEAGHQPKLSQVLLRAGSNWQLQGLHVSPEFAPVYESKTMIALESHNWQGPIHDVTVRDCSLASKADVSAWTMADWDQLPANGISVAGARMTISGNQLRNVNFGISVGAVDSRIERNVVDSFAGDGLRGLGDNTVFEYNTVKNCYAVNANHDDGFQSWSTGPSGVGSGVVKGIVLRGNVIINYEDENQPFRGTLQGIGAFDGMFEDWVVENNVIMVDHWHGITLLGAKNCRVVNNTVIDLNDIKPGPPWIRIAEHKNGTPPEGCLVRNNLVTDLNNAATGVTVDHNLELKDYAPFFVNAAGHDLHLLASAPAIDVGSAEQAPATDRDGVPRPQGKGFDLGAYEWHDPSLVFDAGTEAAAGAAGSGAAGGSAGGSAGGAAAGSDAGPDASGGAAPAEAASDDSGCGCRVPVSAPSPAGWISLAALLWAGRRIRRRTRRFS